MPNNLTGDWEAVVEVGVRQINGLLATLHQKGNSEEESLQLLHSTTLRVGDAPRRFPDVGDFGDWVLEYHRTHEDVPAGNLSGYLTGTAPPGAARRMKDLISQFPTEIEIPPDIVRGTARVQVSTPTLSVPSGSTSEVEVRAHVRAHYTPDPGTTDLPQPIHGEIRATFELRVELPIVVGDLEPVETLAETARLRALGWLLRRRLVIQPSAQDNKINFIPAPGSGMDAVEASRISAEVRKALRQSIKMPPVDLTGFPFGGFKGLASGAGEAFALPLQLSNAAAPASGMQTVSNLFLGTAGFAFGIGREFVTSVFQPTIDKLREFKQTFTVSVGWPISFDVTYHFSVTSVDVQFHNGTIELVIRGKAPHDTLWDFNIVIRQRFFLLLLFETLFIRAAGDPDVSVSAGFGAPTGRVRSAVKSAVIAERDRAILPAEQSVNATLRDARDRVNEALHQFSPSSSLRFRAGSSEASDAGTSGGIAVTPDGVIVRGDIHTAAAPAAPHVEITEIEPGKTYSAFQSWIPGGRIERLVWSWVEGSLIVISGGQVKSHTDEHRFLLSIPPPQPGTIPGHLSGVSRVCLRLEGSRILPDGSVQAVSGGDWCSLRQPEVVMNVPSWWEPVTVPVWMPGAARGVIARDAIAAHVTVQSDTPENGRLSRNALVYFADWNRDAPLGVVAEALSRLERKHASLDVIVVVPRGAFDQRREELERRLEAARARVPAQVLLTEDDEGGWTRTFAPAKVPSVYLINARRELVWQYAGDPDAGEFAAALDKHLVPLPLPQHRALELTVSPGQRAPDAYFADGGREFAVHRLRGHRSLLNFWQSWSAPCLRELQRLQSLYRPANGGRKSPPDVPLIVAFHGGKDAKALESIRKELGLSFIVVQDAEQRIARKYGVRCWPTTVGLDADGIVESIQFGLGADHTSKPPDVAQTVAAST